MKKFWSILVVIVGLSVFLYACNNSGSKELIKTEEATHLTNEADLSHQIEDVSYQKNGITAIYPKIIAGGTKEELSKWNRIISSDFDQILHIYSFNPIPGPTPSPSAETPSILEIKYELKLLNINIISILYKAYFNAKFSAYPTELIYATNINKETGNRFRLKDVVDLNQEFVKNFRTWELVPYEGENEEWDQAIKDYLNNISDEDLLMGLEAADIIGSKNVWGINSYYTPNKIGISIGVPNYIGDHVEFEREYSEIRDYLKTDIKILP